MRILGERVIATPYQPEKKTESGIIIPETVGGDTDNVFQVIALGEDLEDKKIKEGDTILVGKRTADSVDEFPFNDETYFIFTYNQIIGIDDGTESSEDQQESETTEVSN